MDFQGSITMFNSVIEENVENLENILFGQLMDEGSGEANEALNISTNEANTAYGEVRGMSFMGMYNPNNSGMLPTQQM